MDVKYYINGINFDEFEVYVSASKGVTSKLSHKDNLQVDWNEYHGVAIDRDKKPRYQERTIQLDCFINATGYDDFITKCNNFISQFEKAGTVRFKIKVGDNVLPYEVYCPDAFDIDKKWNDVHMVGTFKIKLIEPEPVKMVLRPTVKATTITLSSDKMLNVFWGDGTYNIDICGTNKTINHTYLTDPTEEIIITGVVEDISNLTSNCAVIWNNLH